MEKILCAAIWYLDYPSPIHNCVNIDRGIVLCGYRHGHIIGQCSTLLGKTQHEMGKYIQGFITTKNRFLNRKEAHSLFKQIGNIPEFEDELYSEDLY